MKIASASPVTNAAPGELGHGGSPWMRQDVPRPVKVWRDATERRTRGRGSIGQRSSCQVRWHRPLNQVSVQASRKHLRHVRSDCDHLKQAGLRRFRALNVVGAVRWNQYMPSQAGDAAALSCFHATVRTVLRSIAASTVSVRDQSWCSCPLRQQRRALCRANDSVPLQSCYVKAELARQWLRDSPFRDESRRNCSVGRGSEL